MQREFRKQTNRPLDKYDFPWTTIGVRCYHNFNYRGPLQRASLSKYRKQRCLQGDYYECTLILSLCLHVREVFLDIHTSILSLLSM